MGKKLLSCGMIDKEVGLA